MMAMFQQTNQVEDGAGMLPADLSVSLPLSIPFLADCSADGEISLR